MNRQPGALSEDTEEIRSASSVTLLQDHKIWTTEGRWTVIRNGLIKLMKENLLLKVAESKRHLPYRRPKYGKKQELTRDERRVKPSVPKKPAKTTYRTRIRRKGHNKKTIWLKVN